MPVVRRTDYDCVDVFPRQDFSIVLRGENIAAPDLFRVIEAPLVAVGHRDQLHSWNLDRRLRVAHALAARPDQRDLDMIVGRDWSGRRLLRGSKHVDLSSKGRRRGNASGFNKISAIKDVQCDLFEDGMRTRAKG